MPRDPAGNYCFPRSQPDPDAVFECILRSSDRIMCAVQDGTFFFQEGSADDSSARVAWRMHEHAEFSTSENNNTYGAMQCAFYNNMYMHRCIRPYVYTVANMHHDQWMQSHLTEGTVGQVQNLAGTAMIQSATTAVAADAWFMQYQCAMDCQFMQHEIQFQPDADMGTHSQKPELDGGRSSMMNRATAAEVAKADRCKIIEHVAVEVCRSASKSGALTAVDTAVAANAEALANSVQQPDAKIIANATENALVSKAVTDPVVIIAVAEDEDVVQLTTADKIHASARCALNDAEDISVKMARQSVQSVCDAICIGL